MITLTPLAAEKVKSHLERRGQGHGIKVGVKTTGCSGLAYILEYVDNPSKEYLSFVSEGVHIFVDPKSLPYIEGMTMDWTKKGLNEGFDFINNHEKSRCGCGESFRV
jgi:iron-sulfur cluster assembly protein